MRFLSRFHVLEFLLAGLLLGLFISLNGCGLRSTVPDVGGYKRSSDYPQTTYQPTRARDESKATMDDVLAELQSLRARLDQVVSREELQAKAIADFEGCEKRCDQAFPWPEMPKSLTTMECNAPGCDEARERYWSNPKRIKAEEAHRACKQSCGKAPFGYQYEC